MPQIEEAPVAHRRGPGVPPCHRFRAVGEIARDVGALLMADIAHPADLVAAGLHPSPVGVADFVTTTTHKTLGGPRGDMDADRSVRTSVHRDQPDRSIVITGIGRS